MLTELDVFLRRPKLEGDLNPRQGAVLRSEIPTQQCAPTITPERRGKFQSFSDRGCCNVQ